MIANRDLQTLQHMYNYCAQITLSMERLHMTADSFQGDYLQQNAVSMPLLQIGELARHGLTDDFKEAHSEIPWHALAGMRNRFAHDYGNMNMPTIWNTINIDIPELQRYCRELLQRERCFEAYPPKK